MVPRSARGRLARPATVTQLIAELDIDPGETSSEGSASDSIDHISSPDLSTLTVYYDQAGTALICFHDSPESSAHSESPRHVFHPPAPEASTFLLTGHHYSLSVACWYSCTKRATKIKIRSYKKIRS
jgi:hypothetical protein